MTSLIPENITLPRQFYDMESIIEPFLLDDWTLERDAPKEIKDLYDEIMQAIADHEPEAIY